MDARVSAPLIFQGLVQCCGLSSSRSLGSALEVLVLHLKLRLHNVTCK